MANLNKDAVRVLQGFSKLDYADRVELLKSLKEYQDNVDNAYRVKLVEAAAIRAGVPLGPTNSGGCPCCGK